MEINKRSVGTFYENLAARYLENQNVMILERNYRNKRGEIDLIGLGTGWMAYLRGSEVQKLGVLRQSSGSSR